MATSAFSNRLSQSQSQFNSNPKAPISLIAAPGDQLDQQMEAFKVHLMVMKGLSMGTIINHRKAVKKVILETGTIKLTHALIQERVYQMLQSGYSYYHRVNVIRALEAYAEFIGDPIKLGRPKKPKHIIKESMTEAEISVIIDATKDIRERAVISVLAYTGLRNQELCNLRVCDIDFGNNNVQVIDGKGSKSRVACMSGECAKVIIDYLSQWPRNDDQYLFTTIRAGTRYTPWAVRMMVKAVVGRTKLTKRIYPHLFRHALATNMLARGANLLTIKEQLGHAFVETTMIYIESRPQRIQSEYQLFTPSYI